MREPNEFRGATASRSRRAEAEHVLVIVNPQSRGGRDALATTLAVLRDTGLEPEVAETTALRAGLRLERFRATITVDGVVHVVDASSVLVANFGTVLGGLLCFGEEIGHRDGVLDVCVYSPRSRFEAARIFWRMLRGGVSRDCRVRIIRGQHVRIETDPPRPMQADGELLGLTPVEIRVEPSAVRVLVPNATLRRWRIPRLATTRGHTAQLKSCTP